MSEETFKVTDLSVTTVQQDGKIKPLPAPPHGKGKKKGKRGKK